MFEKSVEKVCEQLNSFFGNSLVKVWRIFRKSLGKMWKMCEKQYVGKVLKNRCKSMVNVWKKYKKSE